MPPAAQRSERSWRALMREIGALQIAMRRRADVGTSKTPYPEPLILLKFYADILLRVQISSCGPAALDLDTRGRQRGGLPPPLP